MINQIGETAGNIWNLLTNKGPQTLSKIKAEVKGDVFLLHAAIGWLARENKIEIKKSGKVIKVTLI